MQIKTMTGYGNKNISSGAEFLDYYTWLLSVSVSIENRNEWKQLVIKMRNLIENKMVDKP